MVDQPADRRSDDGLSAVFESLANASRRRILDAVRSRSPAAVAESDLASVVAGGSRDKNSIESDSDERDRALIELRHVHLPLLADAGLVERGGRDVVATDHVAYRDDGVRDAIAPRSEDAGDADLDLVFDALSDRRRRTVLAILADQFRPISVETLARIVAARTLGCTERAVSDAERDRVHVSLVHTELPALQDAGLIESDGDRVLYDGHPGVRARWLDSELRDSPNDSSGDDPTARHVETFEGGGAVLSSFPR